MVATSERPLGRDGVSHAGDDSFWLGLRPPTHRYDDRTIWTDSARRFGLWQDTRLAED